MKKICYLIRALSLILCVALLFGCHRNMIDCPIDIDIENVSSIEFQDFRNGWHTYTEDQSQQILNFISNLSFEIKSEGDLPQYDGEPYTIKVNYSSEEFVILAVYAENYFFFTDRDGNRTIYQDNSGNCDLLEKYIIDLIPEVVPSWD